MWEDVTAKVGAAIRFQRSKKLKITQEELANRIGVSRPSIANIEGGRQQLTVVQLMVFADALGVSPAELLPSIKRVGPELPISAVLKEHSEDIQRWADRILKDG